MANNNILEVISIIASRWKQSEDSLAAFKSVLNLSIASKACKNYLSDKLLINISYRYVRDRSLFVKQKLMNLIWLNNFDKFKSMADLFVACFSKLESVRILNSLLIYVTQHASCAFLNSYLDYFFERGLHVGCLVKFRKQNPKTAIYFDFPPLKFLKAMKMVNMNGWEEKQLVLAKRLLSYLDLEQINCVQTDYPKLISQIKKLDVKPIQNLLALHYHGQSGYSPRGILQTLIKEDTWNPLTAIKVTKELLQLPIEQQPWFFGNFPEKEMKSHSFPSRNFFLVTFIGSRLYYYQSVWKKQIYNEYTKKRLPNYGLLNKHRVKDFNLYQFYQMLADNHLEGMKQMQSTHNFQWHEISQRVGLKYGKPSTVGNQPHPLLEYLNTRDDVNQEVVDWLFELCPLDGVRFEWQRDSIQHSHLQIIRRIIEAGGKISTNLWIQYITKVMPASIQMLTTLSNAWDYIDTKKGCQFVFEQYYDLCKQQKVISKTKMIVLLAWKYAEGESIGFQNLPKELIQTIVDFIDEPPVVKVFAMILIDKFKEKQWIIYWPSKANSDQLKDNLWSLELYATESIAFSFDAMYRVENTITRTWGFSLLQRIKRSVLEKIIYSKNNSARVGFKFVRFVLKYETEAAKFHYVWSRFKQLKQDSQVLIIDVLKSRNREALKFLISNVVDFNNVIPSKEVFTLSIKPKHNLTYEDALKLINEVQRG